MKTNYPKGTPKVVVHHSNAQNVPSLNLKSTGYPDDPVSIYLQPPHSPTEFCSMKFLKRGLQVCVITEEKYSLTRKSDVLINFNRFSRQPLGQSSLGSTRVQNNPRATARTLPLPDETEVWIRTSDKTVRGHVPTPQDLTMWKHKMDNNFGRIEDIYKYPEDSCSIVPPSPVSPSEN